MALRIAINGFGRIGRTAFKQALERSEDIEVVAINDLAQPENLAYLLRYDSVYGPYGKNVSVRGEAGSARLVVDGKEFPLFSQKDPAQLPWRDLQVDVVIESTGVFTSTEKAEAHLDAGAKRVVISAPAKDDTPTKLVGVNAKDFEDSALARITSDASCTTNAVAPLMAILMVNPGVQKSLMTTVHGYTASQSLVDGPSDKDFLRGRAAAANIVPSHTGAAVATGKAIAGIGDTFDALAIRVPVITGSLVDLTFLASRKTSAEEINDIFRKAAQDEYWQDIFTVTEEPLVSTDIIGNPHASIADLTFTRVVDGDLVKVLSWYDNEWGYTNTLLGHVIAVGKLG
ncbi:MAG: type I glyceraldehyde-3-phosphate dehydrogenase [Candidatus Spechtbacterales bacterium]